MNITANNITEVLLSLIALAGEIPKNLRLTEVSTRTLQNQISINKKSQILKVDQVHNRIRLRSPKGIEKLKDFSEDLYLHYMMITNNHNIKADKKATQKSRDFSRCILMMIRNGYQIDNFEITHLSNFFGNNKKEKDQGLAIGDGLFGLGVDKFSADGKINSLLESTSFIQKEERRFFSSRYLKRGFPITDRINLSGVTGILLHSKNIYGIYYTEEGAIIRPAGEEKMGDRIREVYKNAYGDKLQNLNAIFVTNIIPTRTEQLEKTFDHYHIIPDDANGDLVLEILGCENWKEKLQEALYGHALNKSYIDGTINDTPSIELLSCEYNKIKKIQKLPDIKRLHIICFEWQVSIVETLAKKMKCSVQTITDEQVQILLNYLKEEKHENTDHNH